MPTLHGQATQTALDCPHNITDLTIAARVGQFNILEQQADDTMQHASQPDGSGEVQGSMQADLRYQGRQLIFHEQQPDSTDEVQGSMQADLRYQGKQ